MIEQKKLLDYSIADIDKKKLLEICRQNIKSRKKMFIVTLNSLIFLRGLINKKFSAVLKSADLIIPDGSGIIWASRVLKNPVYNKIPGIDFMKDLLGLAYEEKFSVFLLGAKPKVVDKLYMSLKKWYGERIKFVGKYHGYFKPEETDKIVTGIKKVQPDILFVALGSPYQEEFIYKYYNELDASLMIGVGGSFDVISGFKKRAPVWYIEHNLEWLYRSITSVKRLKNLFRILFFVIIILMRRVVGKTSS